MTNKENSLVLVVDDDAIVRNSIASYLSRNGYRTVLTANDGNAVDAYHSSCPELVICDISRPAQNGLKTLKAILKQSPAEPIIVLAEEGNTADIIKAMRMGVSDYLTKPLEDMEMLTLSIENSLNRCRLVEENNQYRRNLESSNQELERINHELEERVNIFQLDQQAGRHVQMSMLPQSPLDANGCRFQQKVIPSLYLSGDAIDYKPLGKRKMLFYIADVSGHGSSSAFITVLLRFRIEQMRREYIRGRFTSPFTPARVLDLLNHDLLDTGLDKHITACMGVIDHHEQSLAYSVAGHYPPLIREVGGETRFVEPARSSFPLGVADEAEYFEETLELTGDFSLYLFSDGILETLDMPSLKAKEEHLLKAIRECRGDFEKLAVMLNLHEGIRVPDDIAVLSIASFPSA